MDHFILGLETLIQTGSHFESFTIARDQTYMCRAVGIGGRGAIVPQNILANTFTQFQSRGLIMTGKFLLRPSKFSTLPTVLIFSTKRTG